MTVVCYPEKPAHFCMSCWVDGTTMMPPKEKPEPKKKGPSRGKRKHGPHDVH